MGRLCAFGVVEMGMMKEPELPDTFGLTEYFVTHVHTEIMGTNVRLVCGVERGGHVHWLYSVVMPADRLMIGARECSAAAHEAFNHRMTAKDEVLQLTH